jgi:hypothetical protein
MSKKSFDYTQPGSYDTDVLTMVGVLMASCGSIDSSITRILVHLRENGHNVGQIHMQFKRRSKQWETHLCELFSDRPEWQKKTTQIHKHTMDLFKFRDILVHSLWMGQDNEATLWVSAVKDKGLKSLTLDMPIPKVELVKTVLAAQSLYQDHLRLIAEGVFRRSPKQAGEFFQRVSGNPSDPTHPSQSGQPYLRSED